MDGQTFRKDVASLVAQGAFQQLTGMVFRIRAQVNRAGAELPVRPAEVGNGHSQRFAQNKNDCAIGDVELVWAWAVAPGGQLVEHPLAMLMNQIFDIADAGTGRCAHPQAAVIDGQADGASLAALELVGYSLASNDDAASGLR